jgi:AcrR family transcriptional regulator
MNKDETTSDLSTATLYQHFRSRPALVEAVCETFSESAPVVGIYAATTVHELLGHVLDFWTSEERLFVALTGVAAVDTAAKHVVDDIAADRMRQTKRVIEAETGKKPAKALVAMVTALTSFETYLELRRRAGLPEAEVLRVLRLTAERALQPHNSQY